MFKNLHNNKTIQLKLGLVMGMVFGFLLQKGGVTRYDVIIGQLLLTDFTVVKVMLSAVLTGMVGVYLLKDLGLARIQPKPGSLGSLVPGGLVFGAGFGLLGYCPGTVAGAAGQGSLDALFGGVTGLLLGTWIFASLYPRLEQGVLAKGYFGEITMPHLFRVNHWILIPPTGLAIVSLLLWLEKSGL